MVSSGYLILNLICIPNIAASFSTLSRKNILKHISHNYSTYGDGLSHMLLSRKSFRKAKKKLCKNIIFFLKEAWKIW